jgi:hypothetical protein
MNRKVAIVNAKTGAPITVDEINLSTVNYDPADHEWFDLAWENAVDDGLVEEIDKDNYRFSFSD